ncbi:MAG: leucine-rich repeat domain-containing protein, partial [Holosporales bacterium]|nr:leucine-rich repeat domain-containing protein [Holosporales bacterium]
MKTIGSRKKKIFSAIFVSIVGVLGMLSKTEAMRPCQDEVALLPPWEFSENCALLRRVFACGGQLVPGLGKGDPSQVGRELKAVLALNGWHSHLRFLCIPASVEVLRGGCFSNCRSLIHVVFEANSQITRMEGGAFENCASLESLCIPASVEVLSDRCFSGCRSLFIVGFAANCKITRIERGVFENCVILQSLRIPRSMQEIGERCCKGCTALISFTFEGDA